jgi:hypothetical protein
MTYCLAALPRCIEWPLLDFLAFSASKRKRRPPELVDPAELLALATACNSGLGGDTA